MFDFKFSLAHDINLQPAVNDEKINFAKSTTFQVKLDNWADFIVFLAKKGVDVDLFDP